MPRRKLTDEEKAERKAKREFQKRVDNKRTLLERSLKDCKRAIERGLREPTYILEVGDRVKWGNWEWCKVLQIFENGMYYKILKISPNIAYGKRIGTQFEIDYAVWVEIRPYRTVEEQELPEQLEEDDDIFFQYGQREISSILHLIYQGSGLDLNPDYQRDHVWTESQKVKLIKSIFRNIDIGKFTIIRRSFESSKLNYYEVLDGKQRIQAILDFYENRIQYRGKYYNDLHWKDRNHFVHYSINWAETEPLTKEQKYRYFLKLNVSGTPMAEEHLEKVQRMYEKERKKNEN